MKKIFAISMVLLMTMALVLTGCAKPTDEPEATPTAPVASGPSNITAVQSVFGNSNDSYKAAYLNDSGYDNTAVGEWQTITTPITVANAGYIAENFAWNPNYFRIRGMTADPDTEVTFYIKNILVTNGTNTPRNVPVTSGDTWLTGSYVSQGTATLSLETIGDDDCLMITGTTATANGATCVEIQLGFDPDGSVDMSGDDYTLTYDVYVVSAE